MRTKIIVLLTALTLALSVGTSPALAKKSDEAATHGLTTAAAAASNLPEASAWSWGMSSGGGNA